MATWTYGERFAMYLEEGLARGGSVPAIIRLADAFERRNAYVRADLFEAWLGEHVFFCGRCGRRFSPDRRRTGEDAQITCELCQGR